MNIEGVALIQFYSKCIKSGSEYVHLDFKIKILTFIILLGRGCYV